MCSSPHWQVGQSGFREKLSPANREQRLSRWADFAKNCLPRIGSKVSPRFREKYRALGRQKKWGPTCDRDISNSAIYTTAIYRAYTVLGHIEQSIKAWTGIKYDFTTNKHGSGWTNGWTDKHDFYSSVSALQWELKEAYQSLSLTPAIS